MYPGHGASDASNMPSSTPRSNAASEGTGQEAAGNSGGQFDTGKSGSGGSGAGNAQANDGSEEESKRDPHTSLVCLSLVARHHGVDISADRLIHEYSLENKEPDLRRILRIAKDNKLKAKSTKLALERLAPNG